MIGRDRAVFELSAAVCRRRASLSDVPERESTSDDIARAVFAAAEGTGEPVPLDQSARLVGEIGRLCGQRHIVGFTAATVGSAAGYVFTIIGEEAYLVRWESDALEVTFLGAMRGFVYREWTKALGGMPNYEGEPWVAVAIEHESLPGEIRFEARDWSVTLISELRQTLRRWTAAT